MLEDAAAERDGAQDHRQGQADLMDDRRAEHAAGRRQQGQQHRGRQAMHQAQAGKANGDPVEPGVRERSRHSSRANEIA